MNKKISKDYSKLLEKRDKLSLSEYDLKNKIVKCLNFYEYDDFAEYESCHTGEIWQYSEKEYIDSLSIEYYKIEDYCICDCYQNKFLISEILKFLENKNVITFEEF